MQRRAFLPLILTSALLPGCGFVVMHTARKVYRDVNQAEADLADGLARYAAALRRNEPAQAAALFTDDGELAQDGAAPHKGRAAIQAALTLPGGWRVDASDWQASSTQIDGDRAIQQGRFRQTRFEVQWVRQGGPWRIQRLSTETT